MRSAVATSGERVVQHTARVHAPAAVVWAHITEVDIAAIPRAWWMTLLGIPHPLRAELQSTGVGGRRTKSTLHNLCVHLHYV